MLSATPPLRRQLELLRIGGETRNSSARRRAHFHGRLVLCRRMGGGGLPCRSRPEWAKVLAATIAFHDSRMDFAQQVRPMGCSASALVVPMLKGTTPALPCFCPKLQETRTGAATSGTGPQPPPEEAVGRAAHWQAIKPTSHPTFHRRERRGLNNCCWDCWTAPAVLHWSRLATIRFTLSIFDHPGRSRRHPGRSRRVPGFSTFTQVPGF